MNFFEQEAERPEELPSLFGKLYTGIAEVDCVAINPDETTKLKLGIISQQAFAEGKIKPTQYMEPDGRYRVDFWLQVLETNFVKAKLSGESYLVRLSIWVKNESVKLSDKGNIQALNARQASCYITEAEFSRQKSSHDWFEGPYRKARVGEATLYRILNLMLGVGKDAAPLQIPFEELCKGNLTVFFRSFQGKDGKPRKRACFKVLLGVKRNDETGRYYAYVNPKGLLHLYKQPDKKLWEDVVESLHFATSTYCYGFEDPTFTHRTFRFKEFTEQMLDVPVGQFPTPENQMPDEALDQLHFTPITPIGQTTPKESSSPLVLYDEDLPF